MVKRSNSDRRRAVNNDKKLCRICASFLVALSMVVGPIVWERITSIASGFLKPTSLVAPKTVRR